MFSIPAYISQSQYLPQISNTENQLGIPSGLLAGLLYAESGLGIAGNQGNGGGIGQFTVATGATYNVDPGNDLSGIAGSGQYLADLHAGNGSWVTSLQQYGTLPNDLTVLNPGQEYAYKIAASADGTNPNTPAGNTPEGNGYDTTQPPATNSGYSFADFTKSVLNHIPFGSVIGTFFEHVGIYIIALVLIVLGVADLVFGQSPTQVGNTIRKAIK